MKNVLKYMKAKTIIALSILCWVVSPAYSQEIYNLEKCKQLALENNVNAKNSQLSVEMAEQAKKEAFTNYFPSVSATGMGFVASKPMMSMEMDIASMAAPMMAELSPIISAMASMLPAGTTMPSMGTDPVKVEAMKNGIVGGVMAAQPLFAGGQIVNGNKLAKEGIAISKLQQKMSDDEVLLETEQYYWQIVSLKGKIKTIEEAEIMLQRIHKDVSVTVEAGLTTRNDLLRVELERNKLESGKLKATNGLSLLKMLLGQHIGVPSDDFDIETPSFGHIPSPLDVCVIHSEALTNRTEYQLLDKSVRVAELQVKMKRGEQMPTVAVGAGYNYFKMDHDRPMGMDDHFGMAFASVSIPLTGWWGGSHAVKKKKMEVRYAENSRQQQSEMLLLQMQQLWNELNETYQQVLIAEKSIEAARENLRLNNDFYQNGVVILSELLDAQNLLQQSSDQYTEAVTDYQTMLTKYRQATGR